jgi:hypothetical protein
MARCQIMYLAYDCPPLQVTESRQEWREFRDELIPHQVVYLILADAVAAVEQVHYCGFQCARYFLEASEGRRTFKVLQLGRVGPDGL